MDRAGIGEMAEALAAPAPDGDYAAVLESATNAILNAQSFQSPYPLILFRDFFPGEFYRRLLKRFPANDRFVQLNGEGTRRQYNLYDDRADPGSEEGRAAWSVVRRVLSSPEIASALRTKLDAGFKIRAKGSREGWPIPMFPRPVVYADLDGYAIKPHPDTRRKVLTMQIYLPEDETPARPRHDDLQDFADGRVRLEVLWPGQGQDLALPAEHRLRVRRHPPGLFAAQIELAWARGDIGSGRKAAPVDPQHLLSRARRDEAGM